MKREAIVSFVLFVLLSVSVFPISTFPGSVDSHNIVGFSASQSTEDLAWTMFHHDPKHTGYSPSIAPNTNQTLWTYTTSGKVESAPAVAGGFVYVGSYTFPSYSGYVYCLNAATGSLVWSYSTGWGVSFSSPAVADGLVYVGACDNAYFYCLNATSGALVWRYSGGGSWWGASPAVVGGLVYMGCDNGYVYCLNATSGVLVWRFATGYYVNSSPAVVGDFVYVGSWNKNVYCLDAATGALIWNYTTGAYVASSPAVVGGFVYVGSADGYVYCLNAASGAFVWSCLTGGGASSPAVVGGFVYVGSGDNSTYCLNAATGSVVWHYTTGGPVSPSSPAVACTKKVFVGSTDGVVYCLDASTGALIWKYATGGEVWSSPAVADGTVFVGSNDGKVYAFGPASYDVKIEAYCKNVALDPGVQITKDGVAWPLWTTPYTFYGLVGDHTFGVPLQDPIHPFIGWSNGVTIENITVSPSCSAQNYTAFYYLPYLPPPHDGCPFLHVYDGEEYVNEGLLNIEGPAGSDISVNHTLNTQPKRVGDTYLIQLVEDPLTVSHVDQVALYAVLEDGTTVKLSLSSAWHSAQGNVLPQLLDDDGWRTDLLGARWTSNGESQSVQLAFSALAANIRIEAFIFHIEGNAWCWPRARAR